MSTPRSVETKITDTVDKITKGLGEYFRKNVNASCKKVRSADEAWFDEVLNELIQDFQAKCSEQARSVLKEYSVAEKSALITQANTELRVSKPWSPSGDPEKDARAHLLVHDIEHAKQISQTVLDLHRHLRPKLTELRTKRRQVKDQYAQLQLLARQIEEVSGLFCRIEITALCVLRVRFIIIVIVQRNTVKRTLLIAAKLEMHTKLVVKFKVDREWTYFERGRRR
ncbi:unnamed protein product [Echinostoma caproni]|uniref:BAR domain-containing protein n=1 Tax=Echinostoma caproni TaxID=27848 RepID=A0A183BBJ1_9TREM|nr:unnamed protein product [Echinostoma caproni]